MLDKVKQLNLPMGVWQSKIEKALGEFRLDSNRAARPKTTVTVSYPDVYTAKFSVDLVVDSKYNPTKVVHLARFSLSFLPSCAGIIVSHGLFVSELYRGNGIAQKLQDIKKEIARDLKASLILATVNVENAPQKSILNKFGWQAIKSFFNKKTGNQIEIQVIDL